LILFRALESDLMLISVSFAFSLSKFDLISSVSSSLCLSSFSSWFHASFSSFFVASDSESVIKKMMIASCDLSFNSTQSQMFLEFEEYIKKKMCFLVLDIEINKDDISEIKKNVEDVTIVTSVSRLNKAEALINLQWMLASFLRNN